jgi:hypothetical protein
VEANNSLFALFALFALPPPRPITATQSLEAKNSLLSYFPVQESAKASFKNPQDTNAFVQRATKCKSQRKTRKSAINGEKNRLAQRSIPGKSFGQSRVVPLGTTRSALTQPTTYSSSRCDLIDVWISDDEGRTLGFIGSRPVIHSALKTCDYL